MPVAERLPTVASHVDMPAATSSLDELLEGPAYAFVRVDGGVVPTSHVRGAPEPVAHELSPPTLRDLRRPPSSYLSDAAIAQVFYLAWRQLAHTYVIDAAEAAATACAITLESVDALVEPVGVRYGDVVHVFEYAALRRCWEEGRRLVNPINRQPVDPHELVRVVVRRSTASDAVEGCASRR